MSDNNHDANTLSEYVSIGALPTQVRRQLIQEGIVGTNLYKAPNPYTETPVTPENFPPVHDDRPRAHKPKLEKALEPQLNRIYDSLRTTQAWRYTSDNLATGVITTIANTQVAAPCTLLVPLDVRLSRWPGAVQMYLVLRSFSMAPQTATIATVEVLDCLYQDTVGGQLVALGDFLNNSSINVSPQVLIPTPITDPGVKTVGNLLITLATGGTPGTYNFQVGYSYAYLLPEIHGYEQVEVPPYVAWNENEASVTHSN
jgi:hypothetical protein